MTDREFIEKRILIEWKFDSNSIPSGDNGLEFFLTTKDETISLPLTDFLREIKCYYGDWYSDEYDNTLLGVINIWYENEKKKILSELMDEFLNLRVILGDRNWVCIDNDNEIFFWKKLVIKYKDKYSKRIIKHVYDKWFEDEVIKESEKIMNSKWF